MAGFDAVDVQAVIPQQAITVQLADAVESELFLTIDRVFVRHIADQRLANQRHVARRAVLAVSVEAVNGLEMGVFQAEGVDVVVHQADEGILAAGDIVGHRHAGIVTGLQVDTADQLGNRHLHPRLEEHQGRAFEYRVAGGPGVVADGDQIGLFEFARFHRLTNNIAGHHFGQTGRVAAGVGVVFSQHLARIVIDKDPGFGVNLRGAWDHRFDIQVIGAGSGGERCNGERRDE